MSSFNFGGPVMSAGSSTDTAANRENRDVAQQGVENKFTAVSGGSVRDLSAGTATTIAATAAGGRVDRAYLEQKGDDKLSGDLHNPTTTVDADGRIDRLYVDRTTGISALDSDGTKGDLFDELNNWTGLYPF